MDIFGLTPIDTALSSLGLNCSQRLIEYLFVQTRIGVVAFLGGFFLNLWQSANKGNLRYLITYFFISLTVIFLLIIPKRQEPSIISAQEIYGAASTITAQSIKDMQTSEHAMPTILSFAGQMADSMSIGAIYTLDNILSFNVRFLPSPFGPQELSLQANQFLISSVSDVHLRDDLDDFIYAQYLPSLLMYKNNAKNLIDIHSLWPGHQDILKYYSSIQNTQWEALKERLKNFINDPKSLWKRIKELLISFGVQQNNLDDQIMASIIRGQINRTNTSLLWYWTGMMQVGFPYMYGFANYCLYVSFSVLMLAIVSMCRLNLFLRYIEVFVWVKSLPLSAALSFYISLFIVRIQIQTSPLVNWFWDYPYYAVVASVLLCLLPLVSFFVIHQSFQRIINHT